MGLGTMDGEFKKNCIFDIQRQMMAVVLAGEKKL